MRREGVTLIDVHNHILSRAWVDFLAEHGGHRYQITRDVQGRTIVLRKGARFLGLTDAMFDPEMRLRAMNEVGVSMQFLSYTCPNCYWAEAKVAAKIARTMNDHLAEVCARWPHRFRGLASLPMQNVDLALEELERAADQLGMAGLILLANVNETPLDDPRFEPIWAELDRRRLPVLLHPTVPPGAESMGMDRFGLVPSLGFMFDTTLAVTRMILAGVLERYPHWPLIVGHAGATLPYLAGRLDICYANIPETRQGGIPKPPSEYLKRLYYDTVTFDLNALMLVYRMAGARRLIYGSDYPHVIGDMKGCADRVAAMPIPDVDKELIRTGNARRIFGLE
jgi:aminocarboxymuconate-semialdehyde decarboxylase